MPVRPLGALPGGSDTYIDANIFVYGLLSQSTECKAFFERLGKDIYGYSDVRALHDAMHKLMVAEAREAWPSVKSARDLKQKPELVRSLTKWKNLADLLLQLPVHWIDLDRHKIERVRGFASRFGLLCGDSLIASLMEDYGINYIASNDKDFATAGYWVFAPTDVALDSR